MNDPKYICIHMFIQNNSRAQENLNFRLLFQVGILSDNI